jgi:gluconokinase
VNAHSSPSNLWLTVMGVAGCGKSTLAQTLSQALGLPFIEGDEFHPAHNIEKMRTGQALTDEDRASWLQALCDQLQRRPQGAVLSCSALKRDYRDQLRCAVPRMHFVYLEISPALASERVQARAADHIFPTSLVQSQFASLQSPQGEADVITVSADWSPTVLCRHVSEWLAQTSHTHTRTLG